MNAMQAPTPVPVALVGDELIALGAAALEESWTILGPIRDRLLLPPHDVRATLASAIVVAVALGARDRDRLTIAALEHLERTLARMAGSRAENAKRDSNDPAAAVAIDDQLMAVSAKLLRAGQAPATQDAT
jgi:hypothetical protein